MASQLSANKPMSPNTELRTRGKLPVAASTHIYQNALVGWDTSGGASAGYLVPFSVATTIVLVGRARAEADNSTGSNGDIQVEVDFIKPKYLVWMDNVGGGHACVAANRGSAAYAESDHEVGNTSTGLSQIGKIFEIGSSADGTAGLVAVEV